MEKITTKEAENILTDNSDIYNYCFNDLIKTKSFYEYAKVFNNLYGTLKEPVIKNLSQGKDVLFDIDFKPWGKDF